MKILKENAKSALSSLYFLLCNAILKLKKKEKKEKTKKTHENIHSQIRYFNHL